MTLSRACWIFLLVLHAPVAGAPLLAQEPGLFRAGFAAGDITPQKPMPMWGYGARHNARSQGVLDRLQACAIVIEAAGDRLAIVGTDLGRGPTTAMMAAIRARVRRSARVEHVLIAGSHTHHGPVIELTDRAGFGRGAYDDAVAYARRLPELLAETIEEAAKGLRPARIGLAGKELPLNRNRHTKRRPKARDPLLWVLRLDDLRGKPIAVLVNWAAHPVMTDMRDLRFSGDYPGFLRRKVEKELRAGCVFMQGAAGDLSPDAGPYRGPRRYGEKLAEEALALARKIRTHVPKRPELRARTERFLFEARIDFRNPMLVAAYGLAFFPELVRNFALEFRDGIPAELNTVVLNRELAIVTGSGEFFCNHANRLRERTYDVPVLFFGYCNGHSLYFPTIEAVSEGGYGADKRVSPAEVGAGERMMDRALITIYELLGKIRPAPRHRARRRR